MSPEPFSPHTPSYLALFQDLEKGRAPEQCSGPRHTHLPLVPMQQGRPVMAQSMWGWLVWFPALLLVQIWITKGMSWGGASSNPVP